MLCFVFPYKVAFLIPLVGGSKNWTGEAWENLSTNFVNCKWEQIAGAIKEKKHTHILI